MRHSLIILLMLAGLSGHCFAIGKQSADSGDSTAQVAEPAAGGNAGKHQAEKRKTVSGEEDPDCE
jgi:hypothetical protein